MIPSETFSLRELIRILPLSWEKRESLGKFTYEHSYELPLSAARWGETDQSDEVAHWLRTATISFYSWKIVIDQEAQRLGQPPYVLHMSFDDPADAMLARLTWPELRKVDADD